LTLGEQLSRLIAAENGEAWLPPDRAEARPHPGEARPYPAEAQPYAAEARPPVAPTPTPAPRFAPPPAVPSSPPVTWGQPSVYRPQTYQPVVTRPTAPSSGLWSPPGGAWPPPYPPDVLAARRERRGAAISLLVIAIVLAVLATAGFAASQVSRRVVASGAVGAVTHKSATPPANPLALKSVLNAQTTALLVGDRAGFLAGVDPAQQTTVAAFGRLYANLRALHVAAWHLSAPGDSVPLTTSTPFHIQVSYCFVVTTCKAVYAQLSVTATARDGRAVIETYKPPTTSQRFDEPIPWQTSTLTAVTGPRVVVAASSAESSRLKQVLPIAVRAAKVADGYAKWGRPPVYVVYLAGPTDARTWFGGGLEHSTGEAIGLSATDIEVMVVLPAAAESRFAGPGTLGTVLQHEMGHVATLYGDEEDSGHDSLIEGIAEYVAYNGHPSWATYRLDNTREYVASGKWSGQCYLTKEISSSDVLTGSAAYGIGYLMIKRLIAKYGLSKTLDFWAGVEREGLNTLTSSTRYLGVSWSSVNADCATYVRHTLHA
jgi:hypothetical protein